MENVIEVSEALSEGRSILWLNYLVKRYPVLADCKDAIISALIV